MNHRAYIFVNCFVTNNRGYLPIVFPPKTKNSARAKLFQDFAPSAINHPPSTTIDHLRHQFITSIPGRSAPLSSNRRHPCAGIDRCLNERASGTIFPMPSRWQKSGKCVPRRKKHVKPLICYFGGNISRQVFYFKQSDFLWVSDSRRYPGHLALKFRNKVNLKF